MDVVSSSARVLVDIRWHGDQATVAVHGEIDFFTAPALAARLGEVIEVARPRRLVAAATCAFQSDFSPVPGLLAMLA